ncbi:MAG: hypothetical protein ABSF95_05990 [Verrucomicrobiota bacterium]
MSWLSRLFYRIITRAASNANSSHNYINQGWGLYLSTVQYQIAFGNDAPPPMFRFDYADPWDMNFKFET